MKTYLKKLRVFSFLEKIRIIKYSIGSILSQQIPKGLKSFYHLSQELSAAKIQLFQRKSDTCFHYSVNGNSVYFQLKRNSSDAMVFRQIIQNNEYLPLLELAKINDIKLENIIDAGANIGLTTLYLKQYFPNAKIVLLEPEIHTFERLKKNLESNGITNVHALQCGLWHEKTHLTIDRNFRDSEDWSVHLVKSSNKKNEISTQTLTSLITDYSLETIDLLKIDIEGAEKEIFIQDDSVQNWLARVKLIALEIHDEVVERKLIENILLQNGFELTNSGELTLGVNLRFSNKS